MAVLSRNNGPRGVSFYDNAEGETTFVHVLDGSTRFGPRPATPEDAEAWPTEWATFAEGREKEAQKPPVTFSDPPGGAPAPAEPKRRGGL